MTKQGFTILEMLFGVILAGLFLTGLLFAYLYGIDGIEKSGRKMSLHQNGMGMLLRLSQDIQSADSLSLKSNGDELILFSSSFIIEDGEAYSTSTNMETPSTRIEYRCKDNVLERFDGTLDSLIPSWAGDSLTVTAIPGKQFFNYGETREGVLDKKRIELQCRVISSCDGVVETQDLSSSFTMRNGL